MTPDEPQPGEPRPDEPHPGAPLSGARVLVTRSRRQAGALAPRLRELGADVVEVPAIGFRPVAGWERAVAAPARWDLTVLTSTNGVEQLAAACVQDPGLRERLGQVAATGSATADALRRAGIDVALTPDRFVAESLAATLVAHGVRGLRVLLPRAASARDVLPDQLRAAGAHVDVIATYEAVVPEDAGALARALDPATFTLLTFASSRTVEHFVSLVDERLAQWQKVPVAAIGPITAETATRLGFVVVATPETYTIEALVEAISAYARVTPDGR